MAELTKIKSLILIYRGFFITFDKFSFIVIIIKGQSFIWLAFFVYIKYFITFEI